MKTFFRTIFFSSIVCILFAGCAATLELNSEIANQVDPETDPEAISIEEIEFNDVLWLTEKQLYLVYEAPEDDEDAFDFCHEIDLNSKSVKKLSESETAEILLMKKNLKDMYEDPDTSHGVIDVLDDAVGMIFGVTTAEDKKYNGIISNLDLTNKIDFKAVTSRNIHGGILSSKSQTFRLNILIEDKNMFEGEWKYGNNMSYERVERDDVANRIWYLSPDGHYLIVGGYIVDLYKTEVKSINEKPKLNYFFVPNPSWTKLAIIIYNVQSKKASLGKINFTTLNLF